MKLIFSLILVFAFSTGGVAQQAMAEPPCPPMCNPADFQGGYSVQAVLSVFWLGVYYSVFSAAECQLPPGC